MVDVLIKGVSSEDKEKLRVQAALHGHSMQEELRSIVHEAVNAPSSPSFYRAWKETLSGLDDVGFELPERSAPRAVSFAGEAAS